MKKEMKTLLISIALLSSTMVFASCGSKQEEKKEDVLTLSLNENDKKLTIGDMTRLIVSNSKNDNSIQVTWMSTNPSVASVDADGNIEALREGETYIIASNGDIKTQCKITVGAGYYIPALHFENTIQNNETLVKKSALNLKTYILFNGHKFYDADVTYKVENEEAGTMVGENFVAGDVSDVSTDITVTATWRNFQTPTLIKTIHVDITPIGQILINDGEISDISLYTVDKVLTESYKHVQDITSVEGNYDGVTKMVSSVELVNNKSIDDPSLPAATLTYDPLTRTGSIEGVREGSAELKVTLDGGYTKSFNIDVNLPYYVIEEPVPMFSILDGKFYDGDSDTFKSVGDLFPVGNKVITKAYQDNKKLTTDGSKITDISLDNATAMKEVSIVAYNNAMSIKVKLQSYTKVVTSINDFVDIICNSKESKQVSGYYSLAHDIDALSTPLSIPSNSKLNTFTGIFDGNGYVIKASLIRNNTDNWGLFGKQINGTVRNVGFKDCVAQAANAGFLAESSGTSSLLQNIYLNVSVDATGRKNTPVMGAFVSTYGGLTAKNFIIDIPTTLVSDYDNGFYCDGALGIHVMKAASKDNYIVSKSFIGRRYITNVEADKQRINMKSYNYQQQADEDTEFKTVTGGTQHIISENYMKRYSTYGDMKAGGRDFSSFSSTYWDLSEGYPRFKGTF